MKTSRRSFLQIVATALGATLIGRESKAEESCLAPPTDPISAIGMKVESAFREAINDPDPFRYVRAKYTYAQSSQPGKTESPDVWGGGVLSYEGSFDLERWYPIPVPATVRIEGGRFLVLNSGVRPYSESAYHIFFE
jgi:hypothetical protein